MISRTFALNDDLSCLMIILVFGFHDYVGKLVISFLFSSLILRYIYDLLTLLFLICGFLTLFLIIIWHMIRYIELIELIELIEVIISFRLLILVREFVIYELVENGDCFFLFLI